MDSKKRDIGGSKDFISDLPDGLIGHILSFLPTKEAASTSVLSTKWRYLFASVSNLDFNDSVYLIHKKKVPRNTGYNNMIMVSRRKKRVSTSFMDFVDRLLALQGNSPVHKFSLKIEHGDHPVDRNRIFNWILNVLRRGVSDLSLDMKLGSKSLVPSKNFLSKTLVRLKLKFGFGSTMDIEDVDLPKLKTLYIEFVDFVEHGIGLTKFLSGCHVLEDLVLNGVSWSAWEVASVSVTTLKRVEIFSRECNENPKNVSFDTPNLLYLEFTDTIADKYLKVNFGSLVEAKINLRMSSDQVLAKHNACNHDLIHRLEDNATYFIMGICNVKTLYLNRTTLEVLNYCCEAIPLFNNLTHLTIESDLNIGWESLPDLLKNSPNLETLILLGLVHMTTSRCGDVCLCKPFEGCLDVEEDEEEEEAKEIPSCLSSSPVKVLKIMKLRTNLFHGIEEQINQIKHFLEHMPNLEQLILYYDTLIEEDVMIEVSTRLQALRKVASSKCNVQLISDHLSLSCVVPSSLTTKWLSLL